MIILRHRSGHRLTTLSDNLVHMRAARLVATLLLLQSRGRVTAAAVADELEVSVKTARRDLEALSMAGIPVYSQAGRGGGWSLLGGARTDLSGLTAAEARTLFLLAGPSATVAPEAKAALRKLVQALPATFRADAEAAAAAVKIDASSWGSNAARSPAHLDALQGAVIDARQVRLGYIDRTGAETERQVHPLGLVSKAGVWYLVGDTDAGLRTFRVDRVRGVHVTDAPATRPVDFDLDAAWRAITDEVQERRTSVRATVRIAADRLPWLRGQFGSDLGDATDVGNGLVDVPVGAARAEQLAEQLAGWGRGIEVIDPPEVREHLSRLGAELTALYRSG